MVKYIIKLVQLNFNIKNNIKRHIFQIQKMQLTFNNSQCYCNIFIKIKYNNFKILKKNKNLFANQIIKIKILTQLT